MEGPTPMAISPLPVASTSDLPHHPPVPIPLDSLQHESPSRTPLVARPHRRCTCGQRLSGKATRVNGVELCKKCEMRAYRGLPQLRKEPRVAPPGVPGAAVRHPKPVDRTPAPLLLPLPGVVHATRHACAAAVTGYQESKEPHHSPDVQELLMGDEPMAEAPQLHPLNDSFVSFATKKLLSTAGETLPRRVPMLLLSQPTINEALRSAMHLAGETTTILPIPLRTELAARYIDQRIGVDEYTAPVLLDDACKLDRLSILRDFPGALPPAYPTSSFLAISGDKGDDLTKLGITYSVRGREQYRKLPNGKFKKRHAFIQHFAPLIVYAGDDDWEDMNELTATSLTPFKGDSAAFPHIFAVLQHLIDTHKAFLNGDWCFINAVLGLMAPSAKHPCPICIISSNNFTKSSRYRKPGDQHSVDPSHQPLLTINPERIVPTPLHLFLGLSNRIILDAFSELFSKELVEETLEKVKTIHSAGCGGKSDVFQLNGPEIHKWIKKDCTSILRAGAEAQSSLTPNQKSTYTTLQRWLEQLHEHLLHKDDWESCDIEAWCAAVNDMQQNWFEETHQTAFPKLHMLKHSLEFAERYRFLGRASEAQIESYHRTFKEIFNHQHLNSAHNESQRICRTLVDTTLRAVQPIVQAQF